MTSEESTQNLEDVDERVPVHQRWPKSVHDAFDTYCEANGTDMTKRTLQLVIRDLTENSVQKLKAESQSHKNMAYLRRQKKELLSTRDDFLLLIEGINADTKTERNKHPEILERQGATYRKFAGLYEKAGGSWKPPLKVEELKAELRRLVQEESQNPENRRLPERFDSFINFLHVENQLYALWSQTVMVGSTVEEKPAEPQVEVDGTAFADFTKEEAERVVFEKKIEETPPTPAVKAKKTGTPDAFFEALPDWGEGSQ